ncbi:hypothetical protein [Streptomyces sp. DSM 40750]|uniref:hypothetical protein n=1 Tax=Streptomyces sp. DSM 40750 TaxID=2801030 RepID=UPI00214B830C|nr:hypothetical protein [Streptomyces sp. DSM 40750]UUU21689.1 hypothetical protein JIX55_15905 [Streptomyces sp. DSM 40750]
MTNAPVPSRIALTRDQLAALLAHHADVLAAQWRADGARDNWIGAERLDAHAAVLAADEEAPAVAELLDSMLSFPLDPPVVDQAAPAPWVEGDPLMEAIAAAVWERCTRDDPDMPQLVLDDPRNIAAAAASVARAVSLAQAADDLDQYVGKQPSNADPAVEGARLVIRELRRLAAEAQPTKPDSGPPCGNNPNFRLAPGDRQAVDEFKAYLAQRATEAPQDGTQP